jgi:hypothetical protein
MPGLYCLQPVVFSFLLSTSYSFIVLGRRACVNLYNGCEGVSVDLAETVVWSAAGTPMLIGLAD